MKTNDIYDIINNIAITSHISHDGDSLGSSLASDNTKVKLIEILEKELMK